LASGGARRGCSSGFLGRIWLDKRCAGRWRCRSNRLLLQLCSQWPWACFLDTTPLGKLLCWIPLKRCDTNETSSRFGIQGPYMKIRGRLLILAGVVVVAGLFAAFGLTRNTQVQNFTAKVERG